jgi:hypothetical protein
LDVPANVNVDYLRAEMLQSGALPPQLAGQLLAIQDWKTTLPVPVIKGTSEQVSVDGVTGALVVEGPGAVLYWQKNGALYVMAGSVSKQDLLAAAGSLAPAN